MLSLGGSLDSLGHNLTLHLDSSHLQEKILLQRHALAQDRVSEEILYLILYNLFGWFGLVCFGLVKVTS